MNSVVIEHPRSLLTRASLLFRLRNWEDSVSWDEFYRLYRKLVYNLSRRAGLSHSEAEDVTQDVFKRVAETIKDFNPGAQTGSFRSWLMNLTRWRIADHHRHRLPCRGYSPCCNENSGESDTATLDRMPSQMDDDDSSWEDDWQHNVLEAALCRLARRVPAKTFQAFELYARQQWTATEVARELGLNPAAVYIINHRLTKRLKREVAHLTSQLG